MLGEVELRSQQEQKKLHVKAESQLELEKAKTRLKIANAEPRARKKPSDPSDNETLEDKFQALPQGNLQVLPGKVIKTYLIVTSLE